MAGEVRFKGAVKRSGTPPPVDALPPKAPEKNKPIVFKRRIADPPPAEAEAEPTTEAAVVEQVDEARPAVAAAQAAPAPACSRSDSDYDPDEERVLKRQWWKYNLYVKSGRQKDEAPREQT